MKDRFINYEAGFAEIEASLSNRERDLLKPRSYARESAEVTIETLNRLGFVRCNGGQISMGLDKGLFCTIEGHRSNEVPIRKIEVLPFYISKTTVTNAEYEQFDQQHARTRTSMGDRYPVTCITYGRAVSYARWLRRRTGMSFNLPTEPQMYTASAPDGWKYSYQASGEALQRSQNVFKSYPEVYPEGEATATLEVDDSRVPTNYLSLHHMGGNVSVFTLGHYLTPGHWGSASDGAYAVVVGGNFRTCSEGARVATRAIIDIAIVSDIVGIRLVHPDPLLYVENSK